MMSREFAKINIALRWVQTYNPTDIMNLLCADVYLLGEKLGVKENIKRWEAAIDVKSGWRARYKK